mmetsp:Transcript_35527/g.56875  ORF Transcript_35527/g.56875 Transcript_35527/m.56875 type:complete len:765 (+) Transcript_35527:183-2477(+)|eukprot:CAMPEP_0203751350 /NCGR_PEP_ID=MMETSP0098-20131031/5434_1 /ASSEMBLY_ACC=CAM_ASM_000208 /TAXON_ID=96639 /ORGANISM=" , Strain NY0313808BC1" /LENGTH=764 /DNA_ID=CAMNT_0050641025 /DNA_START=142 /DNA_END=2436 /DNA_ORIENTATION=+
MYLVPVLALGCSLVLQGGVRAEDVALINGTTAYHAVDPLLGTMKNTSGQVVPAASVPFGNLLVGPETESGEEKGVAYYYYETAVLRGIRLSHWLSGSATQDYGSFSVLPRVVTAENVSSFGSTYSHKNEHSEPALYSVTELFQGAASINVTATSHGAMIRIDALENTRVEIKILANTKKHDLLLQKATCQFDDSTKVVSCSNPVTRIYQSALTFAGFSTHLFAQFSPSPVSASKQDSNSIVLRFEKGVKSILFRGGVSNVDLNGAKNNLEQEMGLEGSFDTVYKRSKKVWVNKLDRIRVEKGSSETNRVKFYTALYRAMLLPREFADADGRFPSFDGGAKVHKWTKNQYHSDYSAWDTFRAFHPLHSIISMNRSKMFALSLIQKGIDAGSWMPIFPAWNSFTGEMIGDHGCTIVGDLINKGLLDSEPEFMQTGVDIIVKNANVSAPFYEYFKGKGRRSLRDYAFLGFVPLEAHNYLSYHRNEQSSRTIEYSLVDAVVASLVCSNKFPKHKDQCASMTKRSKNFKNVLDPAYGFVNGRHKKGNFLDHKGIDPNKTQSWVTEGSPWQWTFAPMHDIQGIMDALGWNRSKFVEKLDRFFQIGQYDHGNEPSHHVAFLYNLVGEYSKTQKKVFDIREKQYGTGPAGILGNDDAGQISAWFVLTSLGLYQVSPHKPEYQIVNPLFSKVVLTLDNGKVFTVSAQGNTQGSVAYIQKAFLNKNCLTSSTLEYTDIRIGGELELILGPQPPKTNPFSCAQRVFHRVNVSSLF